MEGADHEEGVGESSWPHAASPRGSDGGSSATDIRKQIYDRLVELRIEEAINDPTFRGHLYRHFDRLPESYAIDLTFDKAEDVLLHRRILDECADPKKRPVYHVRFLKSLPPASSQDRPQGSLSPRENGNGGGPITSTLRDDEPCQRMMESLNLERRKGVDDFETGSSRDDKDCHLHEVIFSTVDQPRLLSTLSALLSGLELNIREAHVFSTIDGFCLDVFVVDGWKSEETDDLLQSLKKKADSDYPFLSNPTNSIALRRVLELQEKIGDSDIDTNLLQVKEKIASGSSGDLYRGTYLDVDVAIKFLRTKHINDFSKVEFLQEIMILRSVRHENVVHFYGACAKQQKYLIVTGDINIIENLSCCYLVGYEYMCCFRSQIRLLCSSAYSRKYMPGGNLYDFLHKNNNTLELPMVLRMGIGISKGMEYLHQKNIIHRDLKTANVLIGSDQVVKIADFGVSRHQAQEGEMTAETGTYRWMAPEVINHKPYDHKADVFSFAIVLWELATSKIPYENLTPLQAALGVRQGMRLDIPSCVHPRLSKLIQQCWDANPHLRPAFSEITVELEDILQDVQPFKGANRHLQAKIQKKSPR